MARRLSSMFGLSKDGHAETLQAASHHLESPLGSPATGKSLKHKTIMKSPSLLDLAKADAALPLPPVVTDMGVRRSSRDSRRSSRTESHGTRESSGSRPSTPTYLLVPASSSPGQISTQGNKIAKRKTWLPGKQDKHIDTDFDGPTSTEGWVAGLKDHVPYDLTPLLKGERVTELWDPNANVDVCLFPAETGKGPSFRVSSSLFRDSRLLQHLHDNAGDNQASDPAMQQFEPAFMPGGSDGRDVPSSVTRKPLVHSQTVSVAQAPIRSSTLTRQTIYLPLELEGDLTVPGVMPKGDDVELLVLYRNFISFLCGGAMVSTPRQNSIYSIFMGISSILRHLHYGNERESSWGAVPWSSFSRYTEELGLADVRHSREKNIEAIVLGEAMKSWPLYNEGFVHAVGRLEEIKQIKSPKLIKVSPVTINRLERASLDLQGRLGTVRMKLENFDFPSMFAGIANSQTATEAKLVRFKAWKAAFLDFRIFILTQYKRRYGAWPPKASSKKNTFEENGLNRLLLREVYQDFTDLYDMLVDRQSMTTRTVDVPNLASDAQGGKNETIQHILRSVESEHDRSVPPVAPPMPFDVPLIPAFANSFSREHILTKKDPNAKRLKESDVNALLLGSYNRESMKPTSLCQQFLEYERKLGAGKTVQELVDHRCGQWLFIYAVLQALPMTVVDARDLKYTEGCESFLCMAPRGGRPWMKEDTSTSRAWYNVASGGGLVSLPADLIDHSVEGIYRRSHCWQAATRWAEELPEVRRSIDAMNSLALTGSPQQDALVPSISDVNDHRRSSRDWPLAGPPKSNGLSEREALGTNHLDMQHPLRRSSATIGLEEVPPPIYQPSRPAAVLNPNITFDDILGSTNKQSKKNRKK